jgi:MATE family multidrug resistance protein
MEDVSIMAGAAVGSLIVTQLYWVCGFMKMSITGLSAQAIGEPPLLGIKVMVQGCALAFAVAILLLLTQKGIANAGLFFANANDAIALNVKAYFYTRIWGAPAALINMVLVGWLIGQQKTKFVLLLQVAINLINIVASLLFVFVLDLGVEGVAGATVFAEYMMLIAALFLIHRHLLQKYKFHLFSTSGQSGLQLAEVKNWFTRASFSEVLSLNSHMFVRNLALQFTLAFITLKGVQYGANAAAVNAIIMQFFALIALGLDGIANAVEALVGESKGKKDRVQLNQYVVNGILWSSVFAILYSLFFYFLDSPIVNLLTHHDEVISTMAEYSVIIVLIPLLSHWCYLFDGVFVGLSQGKPMRNSVILSSLLGFMPVWWLLKDNGNISLWIAMLVFLSARGLLLGGYYTYMYKRKAPGLI